MKNSEIDCPCSSGNAYSACCRPFHRGKLPENALQLMRSRYSAYAMDNPEYIVASTHRAHPEYSDDKVSWKRSISQFSRNALFNKLDILDFRENNAFAMVTFTAFITCNDSDRTFTERSYFEKIGRRWLYRSGEAMPGHVPALVPCKQIKILSLAYYDDPILKKKADPVTEITSDLKKFIEEMVETMDACDGMGLAAPQVHHSIKVFVIRMPIEREDGSFDLGDVKVFINPVLSSPSSDTWKVKEACLSIPRVSHEIERPCEITVEYTDLAGERRKERFCGWAARVVFHENDHLEGILYIDHLKEEEKATLQSLLQEVKAYRNY